VPVDSCSIAVLIARELVFIAFCEYIALTLVLITDIMLSSNEKNEVANSTKRLPASTYQQVGARAVPEKIYLIAGFTAMSYRALPQASKCHVRPRPGNKKARLRRAF
jgi:hypothetical protein